MQQPVPSKDLGLWDALCNGRLRAREVSGSRGRQLLLLPTSGANSRPLEPQSRAQLEDALSGIQQKSIALSAGRRPPAVATALRRSLQQLGLDTQLSRVPLALVLLFHETKGFRCLHHSLQHDAQLVTASLPNVLLAGVTSAEHDVLTGYMAGEAHDETARRRGSTPRTIANQLANVFEKLRTSGRFAVLHRWLSLANAAGALALPSSSAPSFIMDTLCSGTGLVSRRPLENAVLRAQGRHSASQLLRAQFR